MSINFSANQYENAFKTLKNWEVPTGFGRYPYPRDGFTQIIANDQGHLQSGVLRSRECPWGTFVGTWDMPTKIPGNSMTNGTARSELAIDKLQRMKTEGEVILRGQCKKSRVPPPMKIREDEAAVQAALGNGGKAPSPKAVSPKSANGRLSGCGEPESGMRSGAKNPVPVFRASPKSVEWPRPGASRLDKPVTPAQMTPPPGSRAGRQPTPEHIMAAENTAAISAANMVMSPEPELQHLGRMPSPAEPVVWPMPRSVEPQIS